MANTNSSPSPSQTPLSPRLKTSAQLYDGSAPQRVGPLSHENMARHGRGDSIKMHSQGHHGFTQPGSGSGAGSIRSPPRGSPMMGMTSEQHRDDQMSSYRPHYNRQMSTPLLTRSAEAMEPLSPPAPQSERRSRQTSANLSLEPDAAAAAEATGTAGQTEERADGGTIASQDFSDMIKSPSNSASGPSKDSWHSRVPDMNPHYTSSEIDRSDPRTSFNPNARPAQARQQRTEQEDTGFARDLEQENRRRVLDSERRSQALSEFSGSGASEKRFLIEGLAPPSSLPTGLPLASILRDITPSAAPPQITERGANDRPDEDEVLESSRPPSPVPPNDLHRQSRSTLNTTSTSRQSSVFEDDDDGRDSPPYHPIGAPEHPHLIHDQNSDSNAPTRLESTAEHVATGQRLVAFSDRATFYKVLRDPVGVFKFGHYLKSKGNINDLVFWLNVEQQNQEARNLHQLSQRIMALHLAKGASLALDLSPEEQGKLNQDVSLFESPFRSVQNRLFQSMFEDHWLDFLQYRTVVLERRRLRDGLDAGRTASSGLGDCFCLADGDCALDNPILLASDGFAQMTGYERKEIIFQNCRFLQGPLTNKLNVEVIRRAVQEGTSACRLLLNYKKDGEPFWNLLLLAPLKGADGKVKFLLGGQIDVTSTFVRGSDLDFLLDDEQDHDVENEIGENAPSSTDPIQRLRIEKHKEQYGARPPLSRGVSLDGAVPEITTEQAESTVSSSAMSEKGGPAASTSSGRARGLDSGQKARVKSARKIWRILYGKRPQASSSASTGDSREDGPDGATASLGVAKGDKGSGGSGTATVTRPQGEGTVKDGLSASGPSDEEKEDHYPTLVKTADELRALENAPSVGGDDFDIQEQAKLFTEIYSRYVLFDPYSFRILFVSGFLSKEFAIDAHMLECLKSTNSPAVVKAIKRACEAGKSASVDVLVQKEGRSSREVEGRYFDSYGSLHLTPLKDGDDRMGVYVGIFG